MKTLCLLIYIATMSGCATTELVSMRYKPKKSGVVRMNRTPLGKKNATEIMNAFCAPLRPEIVEVNDDGAVTGSKSYMAFGVMQTKNTTDERVAVAFDCNEPTERQPSALDP